MSLLPTRRAMPRTPIGKAIRAWPWVRRGFKGLRLFRRARPFLWIGLALAVVVAVARRLRSRNDARDIPLSRNGAAPTNGWSGGTRETGTSTGPGTRTERNLEVHKTGDESPPAS